MSAAKTKSADELVFLPLGGSGEIGMNLNLYGFGPEAKRKWIMLDCGVTFGDLTTPGVDVITPDPTFIEERADDLLAIILTHAHEDHMGAVARLWPRLRAPVYATPFTAWLLRDRLDEAGLLGETPVHEIPLDARFEIGPFDLQFITITHSIPEPNGVAIRTPAGLIFHTGDWKIDPAPQIGAPTDIDAIRAIADEGVLAMVCDSTNALVEGESGSEEGVREELIKLVGEQTGKVAIAAFASNVARLESAMLAAQANDRRVCLVGRSMHRMVAAARHVGLLKNVAPLIDEDEAGFFPADKVLYLCTGSQGEPRAALSRIASKNHRNVSLSEGDAVIFSSRMIPGNEVSINALQNQLVDNGVNVITASQRDIHVSGHPRRDELRAMYQWAKPKIAIPVHGERRHLLAHAELARELQVPHALAPHNGDIILITPDGPSVIDEAPVGRLFVDGEFLVPADAHNVRDRKRVSFNGMIAISLAVDEEGDIVDGPMARARGLPEDDDYSLEAFLEEAERVAGQAFSRLSARNRDDDEACEEAVMRAVSRFARETYDKRPIVEAMILRV